MKRFEYTAIKHIKNRSLETQIEELNEMGEKGWEFCLYNEYHNAYILKREKAEKQINELNATIESFNNLCTEHKLGILFDTLEYYDEGLEDYLDCLWYWIKDEEYYYFLLNYTPIGCREEFNDDLNLITWKFLLGAFFLHSENEEEVKCFKKDLLKFSDGKKIVDNKVQDCYFDSTDVEYDNGDFLVKFKSLNEDNRGDFYDYVYKNIETQNGPFSKLDAFSLTQSFAFYTSHAFLEIYLKNHVSVNDMKNILSYMDENQLKNAQKETKEFFEENPQYGEELDINNLLK